VATSTLTRLTWTTAGRETASSIAFALGAVLLAGEAAVHIQQYTAIYYAVSWIGPLFLANAAASIVAIGGLAYPRTRQLAALAGVVISVVALGGLVVSYGQGLFGWQEGGFRTPVAIAVITEVGAVILLSAALTVRTTCSPARRSPATPAARA
jgi:hypothetical protein